MTPLRRDPADTAVTWLFVPGSRPDRFEKATAAGADEVICDLEDAVGANDKATARQAVAAWLGDGGPTSSAWVRVNPPDTEHHEDDVAALAALGPGSGLRGVVLPKAEEPAAVRRVSEALGGGSAGGGVVPLVESALGIVRALELAAVPGVRRLAFGPIDYTVDIGAAEEPESLAYARSALVVASRAAGVAAPIDGPTASVRDLDPVATDADRARRLGLGGKLCIHPAQVPVVASAFAPTGDELAWARGVLAASDRARPGEAFSYDGAMVDVPVLQRARVLLARAREDRA
jgi:citrate lyase subunit beta / citryl-CoA lyase